MTRWTERPGLPLVIAFLVGATLAGVASLVVIVIVVGGDGDDGEPQAQASATAEQTPTLPADVTPTAGAQETPTPSSLTDPDEVLELFIEDTYGQAHIGECPQTIQPGRQETGICSIELYRTAQLVTFIIGPPFSEALGELILSRNNNDTWSVTFIGAPPLGEPITLGQDAYVYGVGSCLRFRAGPSTSAEVRSCQADGTRARVAGGPEQADGHVWWRLEGLGWASEQYLAPAVD